MLGEDWIVVFPPMLKSISTLSFTFSCMLSRANGFHSTNGTIKTQTSPINQ